MNRASVQASVRRTARLAGELIELAYQLTGPIGISKQPPDVTTGDLVVSYGPDWMPLAVAA